MKEYTHEQGYYNTVRCLEMKLAHAYVPFQYLNCIYQPVEGLESGTIFPELDRPYGKDPEYLEDQ